MLDNLDSAQQIGRRISLRHLHIFLTVAQRGSMAQAAAQLGISQPAVSEVIADLEQTLGVPLFDRSTRGVKPTMYARAMMNSSVAAFDDLKQGIRTLENLADPSAGELWIGCIESISASMLPCVLQQFMQQHPRVVIHVARLSSPMPELRELCDRNLDLVVARIMKQPSGDNDDLNIEPLLHDRLVVAAGAHNHWTRRHDIDLSDLVDEPWVLSPPDGSTNKLIMEACRVRGVRAPKVCLMTYSVPLRMSLAASGPYLTVLPDSLRSLRGYRDAIKILPIELPTSLTPLAIITLKNRRLNPVAERFIEHLRSYVATQAG